MDMNTYLSEMEYAVTQVLQLIRADHDRLDQLDGELKRLTNVVADEYRQVDAIADAAEDADDVAFATGRYWDNYFGLDKQRHDTVKEVEELRDQISARQMSIDALAGALLQIAKQGLSAVHGRHLSDAPSGRSITSSQGLAAVIWQGRNQSMHWEDGQVHPPVVQCFQELQTEVHSEFGDFNQRNLAFALVNHLGWQTWSDFRDDMRKLA